MKALTISEPFASLIVYGREYLTLAAPKWVENRSWRAMENGAPYCGRLAIHAGKGSRYLDKCDLDYHYGASRGRVIGTARIHCYLRAGWSLEQITGAIAANRRPLVMQGRGLMSAVDVARQVAASPHFDGPWAWLLNEVKPLAEPIEARGQQGLWDFDGLGG